MNEFEATEMHARSSEFLNVKEKLYCSSLGTAIMTTARNKEELVTLGDNEIICLIKSIILFTYLPRKIR